MSKIRPECRDAAADAPCLSYESSYFRILIAQIEKAKEKSSD
jgi:hypothetical protein